MKNVEEFLNLFDDRAISIENICEKTSVDKDKLIEFLESTNISKFTKTYQYFLDGKNITNTIFPHLKKGVERKIVKLVNRYYTTKIRQAELDFAQEFQAYQVVQGEIDDSDIGGLYRPAWTLWESFGAEVEEYSNYSLGKLFSLFPQEKFRVEYFKDKFVVSLPDRNLHSKSHLFFIAFLELVRELKKRQPMFIYHYFDKLSLDYKDEDETAFPYDTSYIMYSEKELNEFIKEDGVVYKKIQL